MYYLVEEGQRLYFLEWLVDGMSMGEMIVLTVAFTILILHAIEDKDDE